MDQLVACYEETGAAEVTVVDDAGMLRPSRLWCGIISWSDCDRVPGLDSADNNNSGSLSEANRQPAHVLVSILF